MATLPPVFGAPINTNTAGSTPAILSQKPAPVVATPQAPVASVPAPTNNPAPVVNKSVAPVVSPKPVVAPKTATATQAIVAAPVATPMVDVYDKSGNKTSVSQEDFNTNPFYKNEGYTTTPPTVPATATTIPTTPTTATPKDITSDITTAINSGLATPAEIAISLGVDVSEVNTVLSNNDTLQALMDLKATSNKNEEEYQNHLKIENSITNGTFALTPSEQADLADMKKLWDKIREDQIIANKNYEGAILTGEIRSGRQEFMNGISQGIYKQAINDGVDKMAEIETKASAAVRAYKDAVEAKNYKAADAAYADTQAYLAKKADSIKEMYTLTNNAYKDQRDFNFKVEVEMNNAILESDKFNYTQKQDAFKNAMENDKFTYQQKQDAFNNMLNSDKFTWQQKQDNLNQYDKDRTYQLSLDKASAIDTPASQAEWVAAGSPGTYSSFLIRKGTENVKPANASQTAAAGYALRMKSSMDGVAKLSVWFDKQGLLKQGFINSDTWMNFMKSPEGKAMEQYERDFVNAALRKESGAAIAPSEFESAKKQYFPSAGDSAALIKQKLDNMKTKMSGMIMESGSALSSDFQKAATTVKFDDLNQYLFYNEDKASTVDELRKQFPDKSPGDILDFLQNQSSFNSVGGDTNSAVVEKAVSKADGTNGGQCGRFVNQLTGLGVGDSYQSKIAKMDKSIKYPEPGMVFTMPYGQYGHTGIIVSVNNDGTATVKDSNYGLNEKIQTHKIAISKMTGFARV